MDSGVTFLECSNQLMIFKYIYIETNCIKVSTSIYNIFTSTTILNVRTARYVFHLDHCVRYLIQYKYMCFVSMVCVVCFTEALSRSPPHTSVDSHHNSVQQQPVHDDSMFF